MIDIKAIKAAAEAELSRFGSYANLGSAIKPGAVIALCDEIERMTTIASELQDLCDRQAKRLAEVEKDAARYQWLKNMFGWHIVRDYLVDVEDTNNLDAVIDAAMEAK